jgi:hypothetical protein
MNGGKLFFGRTSNHTTSDQYFESTTLVNTGNWVHCAVTVEVNTLKFYINNSLDSTHTFTVATGDCSVGSTNSNFVIASRTTNAGAASAPFPGKISNINIFDYLLSSTQIASLYNSGSPINPMTLKPAPIAYYPLGGNASTGGDSTNTLSVPNIAVPDASVFDFNASSDYIDFGITPNSLVGSNNAYTVSAWVNPDTSGNLNIIGAMDTSNRWYFRVLNGYASYAYGTATGDNGYNTEALTGVSLNTWSHIMFTFDGSTTHKIYINGDLKLTQSSGSGQTVTSTRDLYIGALNNNGSTQNYFNGQLSNIAIWNSDQSSEISNIYNSGVPATTFTNTPTAWYKLDQSANWEADTAGNWQIPDAVSSYPQSFDFDAQDYIEVPQINTTGAISISGWVKTTDANYNMIYNEDEALRSGGNRNLFFSTVGSFLRLNLRFDTGTSVTVNTSGVTLNDGNWHHVAGVWNGTTDSNEIKLFVDGILRGQGTATETTRKNFTMLGNIGGSTATYDMNGPLSNIQTYTTGLTYGSASSLGDTATGQIAELYNNGTPLTNAIATDNLKGWWKLNNNEKFDGTNWSVENQKYPAGFDSALSFDGVNGQNINVGTISSLNNASAFTIGFWAKLSNPQANSGVIFENKLDNSNLIWIYRFSGLIYFHINVSGSKNGYVSAPSANTWTHIAMVFDGSGSANSDRLKVYYNGVEQTLTYGGTIPATTGTYGTSYLGSMSNGTNEYNGLLSNFAIYNTALDSTALTALYNNGTPETSISSSPVSWWKLNNLTTGIQDSIGSNNGTNNGATKVNTFVSTEAATSSGMTEQNLVNNNVSVLNGESSGMDTSNLVTSTLTRQVPYNSYSLNFDAGNPDNIEATKLGLTTAISVSAWVKTTTTSNTRIIVNEDDWGSNRNWHLYIAGSNKVLFRAYDSGGSEIAYIIRIAAGEVTDGNWHHICITWDGTTTADSIKLIIDGDFETATATGTGINTDNIPLAIASASNSASTNTFDGGISNVVAWDKALTSTEILKLYNSGVPGDLSSFNPSPIAWWSLGSDSYFNGANYICPDLVGSNNGTSSGMDANALIGDAPNSTGNGTSTNMAIDANLTGNAPNSSNNSFSVNMDYADRVEDVAPTP